MTIEEAIKTALEFERKVHALYELQRRTQATSPPRRCSRLWRRRNRATYRIWKAAWPSGRRTAACRPKSCAPSCPLPSASGLGLGVRAQGSARKRPATMLNCRRCTRPWRPKTRPRPSTFGWFASCLRGPGSILPLSRNRGRARGHRPGRDRQRQAHGVLVRSEGIRSGGGLTLRQWPGRYLGKTIE